MSNETEVAAPTCQQMLDEDGLKSVYRDADDSWRHGARVTQVFHRKADGTYWQAYYRLSTDQETNELREGTAVIARVYPKEVTVTRYEAQP